MKAQPEAPAPASKIFTFFPHWYELTSLTTAIDLFTDLNKPNKPFERHNKYFTWNMEITCRVPVPVPPVNELHVI